VPVDDLYALPVFVDAIAARDLVDPVVVSPDAGFVKKARRFATRLGAPLAIVDKERTDHSERAHVVEIMGEVAGRPAVLVDDFILSGSTLVEAARALSARGATAVYGAVTHGLFCGADPSLVESGPLDELFVTNTVEPDGRPRGVRVLSVAPLFGEAIRRIHGRESISSLFD
jgi:ribose-phosphate pyrophosphokinase